MQITNFRSFRLKNNIPLIEIANYADISVQHLSRIELQLCNITPSAIRKIQLAMDELLRERQQKERELVLEYSKIAGSLFDLCQEDIL